MMDARCSVLSSASLTLLLVLAGPIAVIVVDSVTCFSNVQRNVADEECGPNGFCYSLNSTGHRGTYVRTLRGCDHTFVCETMISKMIAENQPNVDTESNRTDFSEYCMDGVKIRPPDEDVIMGKLCCCNVDWCNVNFNGETRTDLEVLHDLDEGTAEDYQKLVSIARKHNIK